MKKTLIALMALAGVAMGGQYTMDKGGDLYAGEMTLTFTIPDTPILTGDYDILAAYYQVNGNSYNVNAFVLNSDNTLSLNRGGASAAPRLRTMSPPARRISPSSRQQKALLSR